MGSREDDLGVDRFPERSDVRSRKCPPLTLHERREVDVGEPLLSHRHIGNPVVGLAPRWSVGFRRAVAVALVLALAAVTVVIPPGVEPHSAGIVGKTRSGCTCHNITEDLSVEPTIDGLPGFYDPGKEYDLNVSFSGGLASGVGTACAGFDLVASAGVLKVPADSALARVDPSTGEATHTLEGNDVKWWRVVWQAPGEDTGTVTLTLVVNAVNGDGIQGPGDTWGKEEFTIEEGGRGGINDAPLFWSVVGIAAVLAIIGVAYLSSRGPRLQLRR